MAGIRASFGSSNFNYVSQPQETTNAPVQTMNAINSINGTNRINNISHGLNVLNMRNVPNLPNNNFNNINSVNSVSSANSVNRMDTSISTAGNAHLLPNLPHVHSTSVHAVHPASLCTCGTNNVLTTTSANIADLSNIPYITGVIPLPAGCMQTISAQSVANMATLPTLPKLATLPKLPKLPNLQEQERQNAKNVKMEPPKPGSNKFSFPSVSIGKANTITSTSSDQELNLRILLAAAEIMDGTGANNIIQSQTFPNLAHTQVCHPPQVPQLLQMPQMPQISQIPQVSHISQIPQISLATGALAVNVVPLRSPPQPLMLPTECTEVPPPVPSVSADVSDVSEMFGMGGAQVFETKEAKIDLESGADERKQCQPNVQSATRVQQEQSTPEAANNLNNLNNNRETNADDDKNENENNPIFSIVNESDPCYTWKLPKMEAYYELLPNVANTANAANEANETCHHRWKCKVCGRVVNTKSNAVAHFNNHWNIRKHKCRLCNKRFPTNTSLLRHVRTHTGEKPFACDICSRRFAQRHALKLHQFTHTKVKTYKCGHCDKSYTQCGSLRRHERSKHKNEVSSRPQKVRFMWNSHC